MPSPESITNHLRVVLSTLIRSQTMNEFQPVHQELAHLISKVEDRSDEYMNRVRVTFTNGYALSIIRGEGSYGGWDGYFEIVPINTDKELDGSLFDEDDQGDDVLGWCDLDKVNHYMRKLAYLQGEN